MAEDILLSTKQKEALSLVHDTKYSLLVGESRSGKTFALRYFTCVRAMAVKSRHAILRFHFKVQKTFFMDRIIPYR